VIEYNDNTSIDDAIGDVVDYYWNDRRNLLREGLEEDTRRLIDGLEKVAEGLLEQSSTMLATEYADTASVFLEFIEKTPAVRGLFMEELEISIAFKQVGTLRGKAMRAYELVRRAVEAAPNPGVAGYLRRMARCYISGFDAESVILARAVVENAVKELFDRRKEPYPARQPGEGEMAALLRVARQKRFLTAPAAEAARDVWHRGSKAVHNDPEAIKQVLDTIDKAMWVCREAYSR
jgi:hypothetical protein